DTLASVLKETPGLERVPAKVRPLLKKCLEKEPKNRLQAIGDWELLLRSGLGSEGMDGFRASRAANRWVWTAFAAVFGFTLALGFVSYRHVMEESPSVLKMSILPPVGGTFVRESNPSSISPDGKHLALVATMSGIARLYVRDLDSVTPRVLAGTEGAADPFWSPDSRFIGFFASGKLKKIAVAGGPPVRISDATSGPGGSWNHDGVLIFAPGVNSNLS